jgi:hypothetical protein
MLCEFIKKQSKMMDIMYSEWEMYLENL